MSTSHWFASFVGCVVMVAAVTTDAVAQQQDGSQPVAAAFRLDKAASLSSGSTAASNARRFGRHTRVLSRTTTRTVSHSNGNIQEDSLSLRQSIDAFTSLEDGQPGTPGEWELEFNLGSTTTSNESDPITLETAFEYTLDGSDFLRNMQLSLEVPVEMGNGEVDGNGDIEFEWQQRWIAEDGAFPTLATLVEVRVPSGFQSSGVDVGLTGIVAKEWGAGTFYFNGLIESANGDNEEDLRNLQWSFRTGYKWRFDERTALIFDYIHRSSEERGDPDANLLELSGEYHVNDHLIIGPGIQVGLDGKEETPNFGAGVRVTLEF